MAVYCVFIAGAVETAFGMMAYVLVFQYYGIDSSQLAFSSKYFTSSSDPLRIAGPPGCELLMNVTGCVALSSSAQVEASGEAAGAYWWILVMSQVFHIFMCKTRFASLAQHGIFNNMVMLYGVGIEVFLIIIFIFIPHLNSVLVGLPFPSKFWPLFLVPWAALFICGEGRKFVARRFPDGFVSKYLNW